MIELQEIGLTYPGQEILRDLSWRIVRGARTGLVGENGAGKTTLLHILGGAIAPDRGNVQREKDTSIGYLRQEWLCQDGVRLAAFVRSGAARLIEIEAAMQHLEGRALSEAEGRRLAALHEEFDKLGGFRLESKVESILAGLGFAQAQFAAPLAQFSGGWQMRAALARLLVQEPDTLLLDEPTNHLDLESIEWLERFLRSFPGALIVASHDRFFLDRMVTEIAELHAGRLRLYPGNYEDYLRQKEARSEIEQAEQAQLRRKIDQTERFVERFRYKASKARQAQSRAKVLDKLQDQLRESAGRTQESSLTKLTFRFPDCERSGDVVLTAAELGHAYGDRRVFDGVHLQIERSERVALVGRNGAGKSTLMRLIVGSLTPTQGELRFGHKVTLASYTQDFEAAMDRTATVLEELQSLGSGLSDGDLRSLLGSFGFRGDTVDKRIEVLSGGERSRVAIARLILTRANFLVLDEPTNHLDLASKELLQEALQQFQGTALVVSHDRYFLDGLASRVLELEQGILHNHIGDFSAYRERKAQATEATVEAGPVKRAAVSRAERQRATEGRIRRGRVLRSFEKAVDAVEKDLERLEAQLEDLQERMAAPGAWEDREAMTEWQRQHHALKKQQEELYERWEAAHEDLEQTRARLDHDKL